MEVIFWKILGINLIVFLCGTLFGGLYDTIINAVIKKEKIFSYKHKCEKCGYLYNFYERLPIFPFLIKKGKCPKCKKSNGLEKYLNEILTGIVFVLVFNSIQYIKIFFGYNLRITNIEWVSKTLLLLTFPFVYMYINVIGRIEKKQKKIPMSMLILGIYLMVITFINRYLINYSDVVYKVKETYISLFYIMVVIGFLYMQMVYAKIDEKSGYVVDLVMYIFTLALLLGTENIIIALMFTMFYTIFVYAFGKYSSLKYKEEIVVKIEKSKVKSKKKEEYIYQPKHIPFTKIIGTFAMITFLVENYIQILAK